MLDVTHIKTLYIAILYRCICRRFIVTLVTLCRSVSVVVHYILCHRPTHYYDLLDTMLHYDVTLCSVTLQIT